jgi:hypothetical protein
MLWVLWNNMAPLLEATWCCAAWRVANLGAPVATTRFPLKNPGCLAV